MHQGARSVERGFTLIELLVVIVIIGILTSLTISALETSRKKSRDSSRISDIKTLQLALELYYESGNNAYPAAITSIAPTYIKNIPRDPRTGSHYYYAQTSSSTYHLGALLELYNEVLANDADATTTNFGGFTTDCVNAVAATSSSETCFDVVSQ